MTREDIDRIASEYFDDEESEHEMDEVFYLAKKALEEWKEDALEQIRNEVEKVFCISVITNELRTPMEVKTEILQIIDKHMAESEESMIRSRQMTNKLSQNIIEHARRIYPKSVSYTGQLTDKQFYEIEKECDIDFYKLVSQDIRYTIRYKGEGSCKE